MFFSNENNPIEWENVLIVPWEGTVVGIELMSR